MICEAKAAISAAFAVLGCRYEVVTNFTAGDRWYNAVTSLKDQVVQVGDRDRPQCSRFASGIVVAEDAQWPDSDCGASQVRVVEAEQFLAAMTQKQKTDHYPHQRITAGTVFRHE
jgi:hypothetical protein